MYHMVLLQWQTHDRVVPDECVLFQSTLLAELAWLSADRYVFSTSFSLAETELRHMFMSMSGTDCTNKARTTSEVGVSNAALVTAGGFSSNWPTKAIFKFT